jgi:hypothetical protein
LVDTYGSSLIPASGHVTYDIGWYRKDDSSSSSNNNTTEEEDAAMRIRQPATTPIAHVNNNNNNNSSPAATSGIHDNGKLVDCNHRFIVYAVKNGLLRVIDKQTGERSLIRGHSGKEHFVTDISFFHPSSDILATVGPFSFGTTSSITNATTNTTTNIAPSGGVFIWRLYLDDTNNTSTVREECLLQILLPNVTRIVWHPTNTNIFVLLHGKQASIIETTKLRTTTINSRAGAICTLQHHAKNPGQTLLLLAEDNTSANTTTTTTHITDASWSTTTTNHIYTSYYDGSVKLWDVHNTVTTNAVLATCLWSIVPDAGSPITHCTCLPPINNINNSTTTTTLILASQHNTKFMLFSSSSHLDEPPHLTQTVHLLSNHHTAKPSYYCVATCFPPTYTTGNNHDAFCLVADTNSPQMFVLHVATTSNNCNATHVFRQITPFQLVYPILSWSVHSAYTSTIVTHDDDDDDTDPSVFDIICYVVQTCAIQTLQIRSNQVSTSNRTITTNFSSSSRGVRVIDNGKSEVSNKEQDQPLDVSSNIIERDNLSGAESYDIEEKEEEEAEEDEEDEQWNTIDVTNVNMDPLVNWLGAITTATSTTTNEQQKSKHVIASSTSWKSTATSSSSSMPHPQPKQSSSRHLLSPVDMLSPFVSEDIGNANIATNKVDSPMQDHNKITTKSSNVQQHVRSVTKGGKSPVRKSKTPPISMRQNQQQKHYSKKKGDELPASAVAPMQLKILKRSPVENLPEHDITASAKHSPSSPAPTTSELDLPSFTTSRTLAPSTARSDTETKEFHDISSVIEEKIGSLLSVHLHAQSQIIRDVIKEVLKTDAEDNSILDAHKIALCQDVKDSVCESVKDPITKAFYKTMREVMIPAYERTTQNIFEQVASAVIESNANNTKDRRTQLQHQQDMALQISAMSENLTRMMQSMASLNEQVTQLRSQVAELSSNSASCAQDGPSSLKTAAVVDPLVHVKQEIKDCLSKGRHEAAFTKALSSNNAEITEYCCQQAEFSQLCARDTPVLSQLILLCVGQQLGSLLQSRKSSDLLEVISWLQDIAVILNPSDPTIERHVGTVIHQLMERIRSLLSAASDPSLKRPLQTLLHILRGTRAG